MGQNKKRRLVNQKGAAEYLHVSPGKLEHNRHGKRDIPFIRIGGSIRYDLDILDAYMDASGNGESAINAKSIQNLVTRYVPACITKAQADQMRELVKIAKGGYLDGT